MSKTKGKVKVLLIEDDPNIIKLYALQLKEEGFFVLTANEGQEGLEMARKKQPDLILLDIILPRMDGFKVLKKLKGDSSTKKIPVILLTNLGQSLDQEEGQRLGALAYFVKAEYTPREVCQRISAIFP